jgi:hypothetical protein
MYFPYRYYHNCGYASKYKLYARHSSDLHILRMYVMVWHGLKVPCIKKLIIVILDNIRDVLGSIASASNVLLH